MQTKDVLREMLEANEMYYDGVLLEEEYLCRMFRLQGKLNESLLWCVAKVEQNVHV